MEFEMRFEIPEPYGEQFAEVVNSNRKRWLVGKLNEAVNELVVRELTNGVEMSCNQTLMESTFDIKPVGEAGNEP